MTKEEYDKKLAALHPQYQCDEVAKLKNDYIASLQELEVALIELVRLKDLKDNLGDVMDYEKNKPLAWTEARRVLKAKDRKL